MNVSKLKSIAVGLALLGVFATAGPAAAQRGDRGGERNPEQRLQKLTQKLNLSDQQVSQVRSIFESRRANAQELRAQMSSLLTEDQQAAFREMRKNRKRGGERPSRAERRAKMEELGISRDQARQLRSLRKEMRAERKATREAISEVLTPEQRSQFQEMREHRRENRGRRGGGRGERGGRG